ncbi:hypothetical protein [Streptomyces boncukensis]|uniref:Uncharacterized protein n=1 Tax=Streptomyces boncukensis TaxID=2711219 RepID=A0A6G4X7R3_9ACTN|nr:hypothetical protein [Streptomyces boncukensis]NGO73565.1 hypothetical protein [Streptomyces boncukensis]
MGSEESSGSRLNGLSGGSQPPESRPGGHVPPRSDLAHSEAKKQNAARHIQDVLGPETRKAGMLADGANESVTGNPASPTTFTSSLHGWGVWTGLRHRSKKWAQHHKQLTQRIRTEKDALMDANKVLDGGDIRVAQGMNALPPEGRSRSAIDGL